MKNNLVTFLGIVHLTVSEFIIFFISMCVYLNKLHLVYAFAPHGACTKCNVAIYLCGVGF